jgi:hypothetical protein
MATQHDLRLVFSEIVTDGAANPPRLELRANVVVAPTMLKALHDAIGKTLEIYEDKIGEVVWPPKPRMTK